MSNKSLNENDIVIDVDLMKYFRQLLANWKKLMVWGCCAAIIGVAFSFSFPKEYRVVTKLAPELSLRSNSLTSLASMAGINMSMLGNNNDALLPTVYPDIVSSVPFITGLFDMPVDNTTLYDYLLNDTKTSLLASLFSLPGKAVGAIIDRIKGESEEECKALDSYHLTKEQYRIYKMLNKSIKVTVDKKTFLVTVIVTAQSAVVAADLAKRINDDLRAYVVDYRTAKTQQTVDYLQIAHKEAEEDYFKAQSAFAIYSDRHQNVLLQRELIEKTRLQNDMNLKYQLYSSLAQQLQQNEVQLRQETPVFAEIVPASVPLRKDKPKRSRFLIAFFIIGVCSASVVVLKK